MDMIGFYCNVCKYQFREDSFTRKKSLYKFQFNVEPRSGGVVIEGNRDLIPSRDRPVIKQVVTVSLPNARVTGRPRR